MNQLGLGRWSALFAIAILISGCGGGTDTSTTIGPASTVTLAPTTLSLDFGQVSSVTPTVADAAGHQILTGTTTFASSNMALVQVANSGLVCAGTWDSLTAPVVCTPATTAGTANVTATSSGITSSATVVSVHPRITSLTVSAPVVPCTSDAMTLQLTATARDASGNPVATLGTPNWVSNNASVVTIDVNGLATAKQPGSTSVFANVGGVSSLPATFTTCPPKSISIVTSDPVNPTSVTLAPAATSQLTASAIDVLGNPMPDITGAAVLTASSSQPAVATISGAGLVSAIAPGNAGVVAICAPPGCNPGGAVVYSNVVTVNVTGTSATTVYVTGANATSIVPIDTTANTAGTPIAIPLVNSVQPIVTSFLFNQSGSRAFIGTNQGLFSMDPTTNALIAAPLGFPGTVLAVSPNAGKVIVAQPTQVFVVDSGTGAADTLPISGATAANFAPDNSKAFIVAGSTLYVYPPATPLNSKALAATANDVTFLGQGSAAYLAGGSAAPGINVRATCDVSSVADLNGFPAPLLIASSFDSTRVFAVDTTSIDDVGVTVSSAPCPSALPAPTTPPPPLVANTLNRRVAFPTSAFTPKQLILLGNSSHAYVTNSGSSLLQYDTVAGTTSQIGLLGTSPGPTTTGGATLDSVSVYVGVSGTNDVQRIDVVSKVAVQQIPVNLGTGVTPDFVVVRPK